MVKFVRYNEVSLYSETCIKRHRIKRSHSIKQSVFKVPKITPLDVL